MSSSEPNSTSWRAPILAHFSPEIAEVARLTIVADPDQLLTEQGVLDGIRRRGFELIPFEDHVAFRFAFESGYREVWDRGERTTLVVVLRAGRSDVEGLPYDLLEQARQQSRLLWFSIGELFPHLAPQVVADLDRSDLDPLYRAQVAFQPEPLGQNATKDFILRHVFGVAPELIKSSSDLLHVLLRCHYRGRFFPPSLDERFIQLLRRTRQWKNWPLEQIVPDRSAFLTFLEERWPRFVRRMANFEEAGSGGADALALHGPADLPFDHDDVRVYIDNLFVEGHLTPTDAVPKGVVDQSWVALGVKGNAQEDASERFLKLVERLNEEFPGPDAGHGAWLEVATRWAEAAALRWTLPSTALEEHLPAIEELHDRLEERFAQWMVEHYASLHNLAYWPTPVMLHHVPRYLAHRFVPTGAGAPGTRPGKHALVVVDGLALDQWVLLRDDLEAQTGLSVEEGAVFAWVPTLTSVSRQSIFTGDPPFYFARYIDSTHKEPSHWQRFWEDHGARKAEVGYVCQKKQEDEALFLQRAREVIEHPKHRVVAVVVGTVDQAMHGNVMGTGGMHASVRHWAEIGRFRNLVTLLRDNGFEVFITADHGNIEGAGIGKPNVGAIADERGERVHIFRDALTRDNVRKDYPQTIVWPQVGLPDDYRALLAPKRRAFINEGKRVVAHGGISLEEVVVPFVKVLERP